MILAFAKKYNQLKYMFYFQSFFVTRETNKEKKKSDPFGTRTQDLSLSTPTALPTELYSYTSYPILFFDSLI